MKMLKDKNSSTLLNKTLKTSVFLLSFLVLTSCNKEFPNLLKQDYPEDQGAAAAKNAKVLFVIADGLQGEFLKNLEPEDVPTIAAMNKNAMYSFNSLVDHENTEVSDALGWTTMMTGVTSSKHGVTTNDFANSNLDQYPTFLTRIKQVNPEMRLAVYGTTANFINNLTEDASQKELLASDAQTKDAVITELGKAEADIIVAQFQNVSDAIGTSDATYQDAVEEFDTYLGELKKALEARSSYKNESWMVIVTSNKGTTNTGVKLDKYDDKSRNTFTMFYAPKFSDRVLPKPLTGIPYIGNGMRFSYGSGDRNTATLDNVSAYNFGVKPNYTIQFMMKMNEVSPIYPIFMSKRAQGFSGAGWNIFMEYGEWIINSSIGGQVKGGVVNDGKWHAISVVFDGVNNQIRTYTDGVHNNTGTMNANNPNNNSPLALGYLTGNENAQLSIVLTNIQIYNASLSATTIGAYACKTEIDSTHPNWNNLIGYWPGDELGKTEMKERTGSGNDFKLKGSLKWESFNEVASNLCPVVKDEYFRIVPNAVDLSFQIYQWLGIPIPSNWNLDGKAWTPSFTQIRP